MGCIPVFPIPIDFIKDKLIIGKIHFTTYRNGGYDYGEKKDLDWGISALPTCPRTSAMWLTIKNGEWGEGPPDRRPHSGDQRVRGHSSVLPGDL